MAKRYTIFYAVCVETERCCLTETGLDVDFYQSPNEVIVASDNRNKLNDTGIWQNITQYSTQCVWRLRDAI